MTTDSKSTVLLVDDEPRNLEVLNRCLCKAGYKVLIAEDGETALERVSYLKPDLILLDIKMPGMDGFETCRCLKANVTTRDIPIIFMTVVTELEDKVSGFELGAVDYITKPFHIAEVLARVNTHLTLQQTEERLRALLKEKEVLLKEVYHRTKNNMVMINSLLRLQVNRIYDERILEIFHETQNRIQSMILVQQELYQSQDLTHIDLKEYLITFAYTVFGNFQIEPRKISLKFDIEPSLAVSTDTVIPCGLILNELLTNSMKYAFPGEKNGTITIALHTEDDGKIELSVRDNGVGLPEDFDFEKSDSLGLQLVQSFTKQLHGTLEFKSERGVEFYIRFKE